MILLFNLGHKIESEVTGKEFNVGECPIQDGECRDLSIKNQKAK
jgi:hypothetical protein